LLAHTLDNTLVELIYVIISYAKSWIIIIVLPFVALLPDFIIFFLKYNFCPNPSDIIFANQSKFIQILNSNSINIVINKEKDNIPVINKVKNSTIMHSHMNNINKDKRLDFRENSIVNNKEKFMRHRTFDYQNIEVNKKKKVMNDLDIYDIEDVNVESIPVISEAEVLSSKGILIKKDDTQFRNTLNPNNFNRNYKKNDRKKNFSLPLNIKK
jgi:hypothetical protein